MPNNPVHTFFSEYYTGLKCQRTHHLIDSFSSIKGKKHRQRFHTPLEAAAVATVAEGPHCIAAALNHLLIDDLYSDPQTKIMMEMIRLSAKAPPEPTPTPIRTGCPVNRNKRF